MALVLHSAVGLIVALSMNVGATDCFKLHLKIKKVETFSQILVIVNNTFIPTLVQIFNHI